MHLRPGMDTMEKAGGLHKYMNWDRPILTDSGGYQVYSLSHKEINRRGAEFRNHINGDLVMFTPENVMDIQRTIGADIIMAFDEGALRIRALSNTQKILWTELIDG